MAKKRKHRTTHRRRRVSGGGDVLMNGLALTAGAALGAFANQALSKVVPSTSTIVKALVPAGVAGAGLLLLPKFVKNDFGKYVGLGMAAVSGAMVANQFIKLPGLAGVASPVYRDSKKIQASVGAPGYVDNTINGTRDLMAIGALYDN